MTWMISLVIIAQAAQNDSQDGQAWEMIEREVQDKKAGSSDPDVPKRIARMGKSALKALERGLDDRRPEVVRIASAALFEMEEPESTVPIVAARLTSSPFALGILDHLSRKERGREAVKKELDRLLAVLEVGPSPQAAMAVRIVARCGDAGVVEKVEALLKVCQDNPSKDFAGPCLEACSDALVALGDQDRLRTLLSELGQKSRPVILRALVRIVAIGRADLASHLYPFLQDRSYPTESGEAFENGLSHVFRVCDYAACGLAVLLGQEFFPLPESRSDLPLRLATDAELELWKKKGAGQAPPKEK